MKRSCVRLLMFLILFSSLSAVHIFALTSAATVGSEDNETVSLVLTVDGADSYLQEPIVVTAELLCEQVPVQNAPVFLEIRHPNNTLFFAFANLTDENGMSTFRFLLPQTSQSGEYVIYASAYEQAFGSISATAKIVLSDEIPEYPAISCLTLVFALSVLTLVFAKRKHKEV